MRDSNNIEAIAALNPNYMGFIFYEKSPRFVDHSNALETIKQLPDSIQKTGVFVNAELDYIIQKAAQYQLNTIQLHGHESPAFCNKVKEQGFEVFKAFQIDEDFDFESLKAYENSCNYFLFDTKTKAYGGSGKKFNWDLLQKCTTTNPIILSGGIDLDNVDDIKNISSVNIYATDINSKFEIEPGLKDVDKVKLFIEKLNA